MAALVKALNAKIRSHPVLNYVCSTRKSPYPSLPQPDTYSDPPGLES